MTGQCKAITEDGNRCSISQVGSFDLCNRHFRMWLRDTDDVTTIDD